MRELRRCDTRCPSSVDDPATESSPTPERSYSRSGNQFLAEGMKAQTTNRSRWVAAAVFVIAVHAPVYAQVSQSEDPLPWVGLYEPHADDEMPYRLMSPTGFDPSELYPVIVSLHGGGGRGTDNRRQLRIWNRLLAEEHRRSAYPSYVLAPQTTRLWDAAHLEKIKAIIASLPSADMDRLYILGHSMGGHGTFVLLQHDPGYFAAAVPSAGTGKDIHPEFIDPSVIKDIPIWAFHGDKDTVCPYPRAKKLLDEMKRLSGNMRLTTWEGDGHGVGGKFVSGGENGTTRCSSDRCDEEPDTLKWLFSQSLSARE